MCPRFASYLAVGRLAEAGRYEPVLVAEPQDARALHAGVRIALLHDLARAHVDDAHLLVLARGREQVALPVEGDGVDEVRVHRYALLLRSLGNVVELDEQVRAGGQQDVLGGRVEEDVPAFAVVEV